MREGSDRPLTSGSFVIIRYRELHSVNDLIDPAQDTEAGIGFDVGGRGDLQATFDQDVAKEEGSF